MLGEKKLYETLTAMLESAFVAVIYDIFSSLNTQPHGMSCEDCLVKECEEEAGISRSIANR